MRQLYCELLAPCMITSTDSSHVCSQQCCLAFHVVPSQRDMHCQLWIDSLLPISVCIGLCRGCASTVAKQLNNLMTWKDQSTTRALIGFGGSSQLECQRYPERWREKNGRVISGGKEWSKREEGRRVSKGQEWGSRGQEGKEGCKNKCVTQISYFR